MPLHLYRRGKVWHYRGSVAGGQLRGSTRTASKETAQRIVAELEARQWKGHLDGPEAVLMFSQAAILYRAARKPTRFLPKVEDHWRDTLVRDISPEAIRAAAMTIYPNAGPASWNRQVIVPTQAIINYAARLKKCAKISVERYKIERRERPHATPEWLAAFMAHATIPKIAALACLMFSTAARISEALAVDWSDVDLVNRRVLLTMGKLGGDQRWAHMPPPLFEALANLPGDRSGKVFGYKRGWDCKHPWATTIKRAGIEPMTYHACRHGFATTLLRNGVDVLTVARLGGWKTPALVLTTYGHPSRDPTLTDRLWISTPRAHEDEKHRNIN